MKITEEPILPRMLRRDALNETQQNEMFGLLLRYFDGVTRAQFDEDLAWKNWVIEVRRGKLLLGFSTMWFGESRQGNELMSVIISGDTIMAPEAWSSTALAQGWIAAVNTLRSSFPQRRCFWLLLSSGFRTYRFLPVFFREFYPRRDMPTPPDVKILLNNLARERYGEDFDDTTGIVRFPHPQRLRDEVTALARERSPGKHGEFFHECNPGHANGDELVCITEIVDENLTVAGRRTVAQARL